MGGPQEERVKSKTRCRGRTTRGDAGQEGEKEMEKGEHDVGERGDMRVEEGDRGKEEKREEGGAKERKRVRAVERRSMFAAGEDTSSGEGEQETKDLG